MIVRNVLATFAFFLVSSTSAIAQDGSGVDETRAQGNRIDWEARLAKAAPRSDQPVYLIVHSAKDCKFCQRWKGPWAGQGEFERWAREHPLDRLVIVERSFIQGTESESMYPPELMQFFEKRKDSGALRTGVPLFEAAIGHRIVYRTYGLSSWKNSMFPALQQLEARRGATPRSVSDEKE